MSILEKLGSEVASQYHEPPPPIDSAEFVKVIESRRSVRRFTSETIPEKIVRECLRIAHLAPTSSNLHQWEFHWVRSLETREKVNAICMNQPAASTAAEIVVIAARTDCWRRNAQRILAVMKSLGPVPKSAEEYYSAIIPTVYRTGFLGWWVPFKFILFTAIGLVKPIVRSPLDASDVRTWAVKSSALASENFMLAMRAFGYDTCPMEGFDEYRLKKLLSLGRQAQVVMVIGCGKRASGGVYGPRIRLPLDEFIIEH
jgi:nitroreductase